VEIGGHAFHSNCTISHIQPRNGVESITMKLLLFLTLVLTATSATAAEKQRDWQTGKVVDTERNSYYAGTIGNSNTTGSAQANGNYGTYQGTTTTTHTAVYRVYETFIIEGDTYAYVAQERLRWRWSKPANLTVNGPVKYAIEKRKLYVSDDDGKEHEMEVVKKILKQSEPAMVAPK
jgi:hypothetical protein